MKTLKIGATSDMHGQLPRVEQEVDIFFIVGDISPLEKQFNMREMSDWIYTTFVEWVKTIPAKTVVMVAGNHDAWLERASETQLFVMERESGYKLKYLKNETWTFTDDDMTEWTIFGTPYCHTFGRWPFMREPYTLVQHFAVIPDNVDIIISHDPPYGISKADIIFQKTRWHRIGEDDHKGGGELAERLKDVDYKLLLCGHIHSGYHDIDNKCVNVSHLDESYSAVYDIFYHEIQK